MKRIPMKKIFRPANEMIVEKLFIRETESIPLGWFATIQDALNSVKCPALSVLPASPEVSESAPRKRGRPRNAPSQ